MVLTETPPGAGDGGSANDVGRIVQAGENRCGGVPTERLHEIVPVLHPAPGEESPRPLRSEIRDPYTNNFRTAIPKHWTETNGNRQTNQKSEPPVDQRPRVIFLTFVPKKEKSDPQVRSGANACRSLANFDQRESGSPGERDTHSPSLILPERERETERGRDSNL